VRQQQGATARHCLVTRLLTAVQALRRRLARVLAAWLLLLALVTLALRV
jgi:hypothetical protein